MKASVFHLATQRANRTAAALFAGLLLAATLVPVPARSQDTVELKIVGGLAGIAQHTKIEEPFWRTEIGPRTNGRVTATIHAFDRSGMRGEEMLHLMRLGVVTFGTALVSLVSSEEPALNGVDLPGLNPDIETLRRSTALYRDHLRRVLKERYTIELLGVYIYPAQVLFCAKPFSSLKDLAGRKVRTSSVAQSEWMKALGAVPVVTPFNEMVASVTRGVVDCAITGTLSGYEIGLSEVTTHVHSLAISWGMSVFGANSAAWDGLPDDVRTHIREAVAELENRIWTAAAHDTDFGLACNIGSPACTRERRGRMTLVPLSAEDAEMRRSLLVESGLPRWIDRCGNECVTAWNKTLGPGHGIIMPHDTESAPVRSN